MAEVRPANLGLLGGNDLMGSLRLPVCANYENGDVCVLLPSSGTEWGETRRPGVPTYPLLIRIFYWIPPSTPAHTAPSSTLLLPSPLIHPLPCLCLSPPISFPNRNFNS